MRRYSFNIDLTKKDGLKKSKPEKNSAPPPGAADGFQMSGDLADQRQFLQAWPSFQRALHKLPKVVKTAEVWDDPNLGAEYVRIYEVSKEKVTEAEPGFCEAGKTETHCFFTPDGTKHLVSRLLARRQDRINEIRLSPDGQLVRLYYENSGGPQQSLEDLFEQGLFGLDQDSARFGRFPNYVLRFFLLIPKGEFLDSTFRGVCIFDPETGKILTQEANQLS